ncbi:MAG: YbaK/EbsC family protein [Anaerolineae bacterium]|nr:YbaK/EbsC family protein [Anaerolineae bacterium]
MRSPAEDQLSLYMERHGINAEHLRFDQSCHSVAEAAEAVNASAEDFVKNICMIGVNDELIVAIVKGEDMASTSRVATLLGIERPRLANGEEIEARTGYDFGGTPSFGFEAVWLIDERVLEKESIFTGGGSAKSLVKMDVKELLRANGGTVARIRR